MKLRRATARDGFEWMRSGVMLLRHNPLGLTSQFALMMLALGLLVEVPMIGPLLVATLLPALSAGWVYTIEQLDAGQRPSLRMLLAPLASPARQRLLVLGLIYALLAALVLWLMDQLDPGLSAAWEVLQSDAPATESTRDAAVIQAIGDLQSGMMLRALGLVPLALVFWHAPVIIHVENASVAKALFGSALASFRNLGAFGVYALSWALADVALSVVLGGLLALLGLQQVAVMAAMPLALLFSAAFYASLHASVHGSLELSAQPPTVRP